MKNVRLSKSSVNQYVGCPYAYKLGYVDKISVPPNIYLIRGLDVHRFHDKFFDSVALVNGGLEIGELEYGCDNIDYKQNIVDYYIKKWRNCVLLKGEHAYDYFKPFKKEKKNNHRG